MKQSPFYFEIKDILTQFVTAFDDIVIKRYNNNRRAEDTINVRYVYAPKQRVMYDIINEAKTIAIPAVAVSITGISRDENRVFNKIQGFDYSGKKGEARTSGHLRAPIPINIGVEVSIIARYQNDMDQILSNFIPYTNPYVVISWKVPAAFNLPHIQEIRSEVLWDGNVSMSYPTDIKGTEKARITADTNFIIKGWLFKESVNASGNVYYVDTNFHSVNVLSDYESMSANTYTSPVSSGLYPETEAFELSGFPTIENVFVNNAMMFGDVTIQTGTSASVLIRGYMCDLTTGVLLSGTNNDAYTTPLTSISAFSRQPDIITGQQLYNWTVVSDNVIAVTLPAFTQPTKLTIIPFNKIGFSTTLNCLESKSLSASNTFIIVN